MATCPLTSSYNYAAGCDGGPAGLKWIAFVEKYNVDPAAPPAITAGVITSFTLLSTKIFRKYEVRKNTAFFTDNFTKDPLSGAYSYKPSVTLSIFSMITTLRQEVQLLGRNPLVIIAMDNQGIARMLGYNNVMDMITAEAGSGTTMGDGGSKQVLTFTGEETVPAYEVNAATLTSLGL